MQHTAILKNMQGQEQFWIKSHQQSWTRLTLSFPCILLYSGHEFRIFLLLNSYLLEKASFCSSDIIFCHHLNCVELARAKISHLGHQPILPLRSMRIRSTVNIGANTDSQYKQKLENPVQGTGTIVQLVGHLPCTFNLQHPIWFLKLARATFLWVQSQE